MKIASFSLEPQELLIPAVDPAIQQRSGSDTSDRTGQHLRPVHDRKDHPKDGEDFSLQKLQHVTEAVDAYMSSLGVNLKFNIDERTDIVQVEVRDPKTDKLIRKIPADEMLDLAASIENMVGLLLDKSL